MVRAAGLPHVLVEVTDDYIWRLARTVGARRLYRGIRTWRQDGPAELLLELLNLVGPPLLAPCGAPLRTAYLQADPRYAHVSSSLVRQRCSVAARGDAGEALSSSDDLSDLVPEAIEADVRRAYGRRV